MVLEELKRYHQLVEAKKIKDKTYTTLRQFIAGCETKIYPQHVDLFPALKREVLDVRKVCRTLKSGKTFRYRVVGAIGCRDTGLIGLGVAKGSTVGAASEKAMREAKKNMVIIPHITVGPKRYFGPTRTAMSKMGATGVVVTPLADGASITSSKFGKRYCRLAGITNLCIQTANKGRAKKGKVASRVNYFTALHDALRKACQ